MEEQRKIVKKNHWTQTKIDNATKKINQEIYERNRQAPLQLKLDDMVIYINDKITRRGIAKGLVSIQEDLNNSILKVEKQTMEALLTTETKKQYNHLLQAKYIMKVETWTDIRFLMIRRPPRSTLSSSSAASDCIRDRNIGDLPCLLYLFFV